MAVHDALGQPGRARRVDDPQRVVEGQRRELRLLLVGDGVGPGQRAVGHLVGEQPGDGDRRPHGRQRGPQLGDDVPTVVVLAVEPVAVDGDQHRGLDLGEPVEDGAGAEVRRAGGPDRADRRRAEEGDRPPRARWAGSRPPGRRAARRAGAASRRTRRPGRAASPRRSRPARVSSATTTSAGRSSVACRKRLLGEVDRRAGEPDGAGHLAVGQHLGRRGRRAARRSRWRRRPRTGRGARPTSARAGRSRSGRRSRGRAGRVTQRGEAPRCGSPRMLSGVGRQSSSGRSLTPAPCHPVPTPTTARRPTSAGAPVQPDPPDERNVLGGPLAALRHRPGDRLLPGRALQHRPRGPRLAHRLRRRLGRLPGAAARPGQRPVHAAARVRLPRA